MRNALLLSAVTGMALLVGLPARAQQTAPSAAPAAPAVPQPPLPYGMPISLAVAITADTETTLEDIPITIPIGA
jgi:hypothetical protein